MSVKTRSAFRQFLPVIIIFVIVSIIPLIFSQLFVQRNIDTSLVILGNIILFAVTIISSLLYRKALLAGNTQLFLRNVYSGMFIKFFVCLIGIFVYILSAGNDVNRPGLFSVMFLYLVYTFTETALLMKLSRQIKEEKNA